MRPTVNATMSRKGIEGAEIEAAMRTPSQKAIAIRTMGRAGMWCVSDIN